MPVHFFDMRTLLKFIFSIIFFQFTLSQSTVVVEADTKQNLSYVLIHYSDTGFYTDENGVFETGKLPDTSLVTVSHLGFESRKLISPEIKDTIFLKREPILLERVNLDFIEEKLTLMSPKEPKNFGSWPLSSEHEIITQIVPKKKIIDAYINTITIPFSKVKEKRINKIKLENLKAIVRVNIYNHIDSKNKVKIFSSEGMDIESLNKDELVISVGEELIKIGEEGIYIGLELMGYISEGVWVEIENSLVRPTLSRKEHELFSQNTILKNVFSNQETVISEILTKRNPSGKVLTRNLAIGLTLLIEK